MSNTESIDSIEDLADMFAFFESRALRVKNIELNSKHAVDIVDSSLTYKAIIGLGPDMKKFDLWGAKIVMSDDVEYGYIKVAWGPEPDFLI